MKTKQLKTRSLGFILSLALLGCQSDLIDEQSALENQDDLTKSEFYPSNDSRKTLTKDFFGTPTEFEVIGDYLVLGDMIMSPEQVEETNSIEKGTILNNSSRRWNKSGNNYIMYYEIDPNLPQKYRVRDAMSHWENKTKLRFVERTNQSNYVYFTDDGGCYSYIGKIGGRQIISVGSGCSTGNTIHEIGHASGLFHEQSHPRRDEFVNILFENITPGREGNFSKESRSNVMTTGFDLGSVMMYGSYFFSKNGLPTITKKNGSTFNVQRNGLSAKDVRVVNKIYQ